MAGSLGVERLRRDGRRRSAGWRESQPHRRAPPPRQPPAAHGPTGPTGLAHPPVPSRFDAPRRLHEGDPKPMPDHRRRSRAPTDRARRGHRRAVGLRPGLRSRLGLANWPRGRRTGRDGARRGPVLRRVGDRAGRRPGGTATAPAADLAPVPHNAARTRRTPPRPRCHRPTTRARTPRPTGRTAPALAHSSPSSARTTRTPGCPTRSSCRTRLRGRPGGRPPPAWYTTRPRRRSRAP